MKTFSIAILTFFTLMSCTKETADSSAAATTSVENSAEESQMQEPLTLKNNKGEALTVTYFAKGPNVAVKIQKGSEPAQKLSAKTTSPNGNPIFANSEYMWEITQEGQGGKLTDKDGTTDDYKSDSGANEPATE